MVRSSTSLAGGLGRLFNLGNNPLASFKEVTEVLYTHQSKGDEINDDLDRQAVEQELRRYEEDGTSNTVSESLVEFWEVGLLILQASDISAHTSYIIEA
jgi:hypothetical protein